MENKNQNNKKSNIEQAAITIKTNGKVPKGKIIKIIADGGSLD